MLVGRYFPCTFATVLVSHAHKENLARLLGNDDTHTRVGTVGVLVGPLAPSTASTQTTGSTLSANFGF